MANRVIQRLFCIWIRTGPWGLVLCTILLGYGVVRPALLMAPPVGTRSHVSVVVTSGIEIRKWSDVTPSPTTGLNANGTGKSHLLGFVGTGHVHIESGGSSADYDYVSLMVEPWWWVFAVGWVVGGLARLAREQDPMATHEWAPVLLARYRQSLWRSAILLACVSCVVAVAWIESYQRPARQWQKPRAGLVLESASGTVLIGWGVSQRVATSASGSGYQSSRRFPGIGIVISQVVSTPRTQLICSGAEVHFGAIVVPLAVFYVWWFGRLLLYRMMLTREARHLCPRCGYDLRATPTQCPECGTRLPGAPESGAEVGR